MDETPHIDLLFFFPCGGGVLLFFSIYYCFRVLGKEGTRLVIFVDYFTMFDVLHTILYGNIEVEMAVFFLTFFFTFSNY